MHTYIYVEVNNGKECGGKLKTKVIPSEEFNMKESRRYHVSVLINHHLDLEKMLSRVVWYPSIVDLMTHTQ